jgi:hypothetical protein
MMAPYIVSLTLSLISIAAASYSLFVVLSEKRSRRRDNDELAAEIAEMRQVLAMLQDEVRPPSRILRRGLRLDRGRTQASLGPILIEVPDLSIPSPGSIDVPPEFAERFGGIWDLADSGASAEAIARATGQPIGRIELILALRREPPDESRD